MLGFNHDTKRRQSTSFTSYMRHKKSMSSIVFALVELGLLAVVLILLLSLLTSPQASESHEAPIELIIIRRYSVGVFWL